MSERKSDSGDGSRSIDAISFSITDKYQWSDKQYNLPIEIKFDFVLEKPETEFHPCWSFNKKGWD